MKQRDDSLWKGILEDLFAHFLRFHFKDADQLFDMEKGFQFLDKELEQLFPVEDGNAPKFVDKLAKVFTKSGKEEWILIHIEVQGYNDKDFAKRMFTYFYRILDRYNKPVTAIAIFTDNNKKFHPTLYQYEYLGTKTTFSFNTYKIIEQDAELLAKDNNPFAIVVLTVLLAIQKKKLNDEELLGLKLALFRNLYQRNINKQTARGLATFLNLYLHFAKRETNARFENAIQLITQNKNTMGIVEMVLERAKKEGLQKGIEEERERKNHEVIVRLIEKTALTDEQVADIAAVTTAFVKKIRASLKK